MRSEKPKTWTHPLVERWMKKYELELSDTNTELGYVARPAIRRYPKDFLFVFDSLDDLEKLNLIYGTSFDSNFLDARFSGNKMLDELAKQSLEVGRAITIFPELRGNSKGIYVGGIRFPKCDFLYTESSMLDMPLKEKYSSRDMRPGILKRVDFIPIEKKYRPSFKKLIF